MFSKRLKRFLPAVVGTVLLALLMSTGVLADSTWQYYIEFTVTDNTGADRTNLPILTGISGQNLIDSGYVNAGGNNTQMKESGTNSIFGIATGNVSLFIPELLANQSRTYKFYTGYSPEQTSFPIIVGQDGYITTADNESLELGNNFIIEEKGWIDTTQVSANLTNKAGAFRTFIANSGNITAAILSADNVSPTSASGTSWIDPDNAWDDNEASYASYLGGLTSWTTNLTTNHAAIYCDSIRFKVGRSGAYISTVNVTAYYNGVWNAVYNGVGDWGNWQQVSLGDIYSVTAICIKFYSTTAGHYAYVYEVDFGQTVMVSATSVENAEHTITTSLTSDNFSLLVSGHTPVWTTFTGSVPNTSNNWTFFQGNVMPYVEYLKIWTQ